MDVHEGERMVDKYNMEPIWDNAIATDPDNLDLKYAKSIFSGASEQQILEAFSRSVIERTDELRFMPPQLFNYYFHFFNTFVLGKHYQDDDAVMVADCYLNLLKSKLNSHAINDSHPFAQTRKTLQFIEDNLCFFNTAPDIYGDLSLVVADVKRCFPKA